MFVSEYSFTVMEYGAEKPWVVIGQERDTVRLEDGVRFFDWAAARWPEPRWRVELEPKQLPPWPR